MNDDLSKARFEYCYHGLFILGNQNTTKGLAILRTELSLLDKFDSISKPCECGKTIAGTKEPDRELNEMGEGGYLQVQINEQEFDLLYDYISKVPWSIGKSSREALATLDWIRNPV
jgi:hypothetical protein